MPASRTTEPGENLLPAELTSIKPDRNLLKLAKRAGYADSAKALAG